MKTVKILVCLLLALFLTAPAAADLVLEQDQISWTTEAGLVSFHLNFYNPELTISEQAVGEIYAQEYGAFVPDLMPIAYDFDIPPIPPESFFDVVVEIPYDQLPPSAGEMLPWDAPGKRDDPCPKDWHWDGNVDVIWTGAGGGQTMAHHGTLQVCPGYGGSCIHVVTNCPGVATWGIAGTCLAWATVSLVNEDMSPAPALLPAGWTGHICVSAPSTVPIGSTCCLTVTFTCGGVPVPVNLCVTACDCGPIDREPQTWGCVKSLYR